MKYTTKNFLQNQTVEIDGLYNEDLRNESGESFGTAYHVVGEHDAAEIVIQDLVFENMPLPYGSGVWNQIRYEAHPTGTRQKAGWFVPYK